MILAVASTNPSAGGAGPAGLLAPSYPGPSRAALLAALVHRGPQAHQAWARWRRSEPSLLRALVAERHDALASLLPFVAEAASREGLELAPEDATRAKTALVRESLRARAYDEVLGRALAAIEAAGGDTLVLGGRPLARRLYEDPSLHHSGAIDLLAADEAALVGALVAEGFRDLGRAASGPWTRRRLGDASGLSVTVADSLLAHPYYRVPGESVFADSEKVAACGSIVRVPCLRHQLALAAVRAAWLGPSRALLSLLDAARIVIVGVDDGASAAEAATGGFALPLLALRRFLAAHFSLALAPAAQVHLEDACSRSPAVQRQLAIAAAWAATEGGALAVARAAFACGESLALASFVAVPHPDVLRWESGSAVANLGRARARRLALALGARIGGRREPGLGER